MTGATRLETPRLLLRPFTEADAPAFYDYARDPRVGLAAGWRPHRGLEETRRIIRNRMSAPNVFAVCERESGILVGSVGLLGRARGQGEGSVDDIGYSFRPDRWGRGYATEAVERLLRHGFEELGLRQVWATCYEDNAASRRVLEKCGFRYLYTQQLLDELGEHKVCFYVTAREV